MGNKSYYALLFRLVVLLLPSLPIPDAGAQANRLKVSYSAITANNSPLWIAKEKGFFGKHGLDVQVVLIESGTTTIQALLAGETQIAQVAGGVIISSGLAGADVVGIAGLENRLAFSLVTQKEITRPEQLKGTRLAVSRFGSASDLGARLILQRLGLAAEKDVAILQVGGTSTRLAAMTKGSVEAAVLTPEFFLLAKKAGFNTLADPLSVKIDFPQNGVATTRAFIKTNPGAVSSYLKAIVEGIHFFRNNRTESIRILRKYLKIEDAEALDEIYKLYREILQPLPLPSLPGMQTLLTWMAQRDPRAKEVKAEQYIDANLLREIEKSGFVSSLYQK
jgi:NitT/TauT family transport system substrate-binding protein